MDKLLVTVDQIGFIIHGRLTRFYMVGFVFIFMHYAKVHNYTRGMLI